MEWTLLGIVGLPGSGKTHLAHSMATMMPNTIVLDDLHREDQIPKSLESNIIITDPLFCDADIREDAKQTFLELYGIEIKWIFFEKSIEQCRANIIYRNDGRNTTALFNDMMEVYTIPDGVHTLKVWRGLNV